MSFYRAQYLRLVRSANAKAATFDAVMSDQSSTKAQIASAAAELAAAALATNEALLRANWPPQIRADIRAFISASAAENADLEDMSTGAAQLDRDGALAKPAQEILHADLGLAADPTPPVASSLSHADAAQPIVMTVTRTACPNPLATGNVFCAEVSYGNTRNAPLTVDLTRTEGIDRYGRTYALQPQQDAITDVTINPGLKATVLWGVTLPAGDTIVSLKWTDGDQQAAAQVRQAAG